MNTTASQEKTAQLLWTGIILFFFMIQAIIWMFAISITASDHSHAVVSNYDEEALRWNEVQQVRRSSDALGWIQKLYVDSSSDTLGNRTVTLSLHDVEQRPIENAAITLKAFHRGRAAEVHHVEFHVIAPGVYSGNLRVRSGGIWQFEGSACVGQDQLLIDTQVHVSVPRS